MPNLHHFCLTFDLKCLSFFFVCELIKPFLFLGISFEWKDANKWDIGCKFFLVLSIFKSISAFLEHFYLDFKTNIFIIISSNASD